ncbi:hypothetical protein JKY72_01240 [Candidatus Gracilibacteria bacterium]|nr:hypothetical protein [Candidatus Gracilibacteria bacterium]
MKKLLILLALFSFSACSELEEVVLPELVEGYHVETEFSPGEPMESSLFFDDKEIVDLTFEEEPLLEYWVAKVFRDDEKDIVFVLKGGGCGGCVFFMDHYYLVDRADLSFEKVAFEGPTGVDIFWRGAPDWAVYGDTSNEFAYIDRHGDIDVDKDSYYEDVWVYLFDRQEWISSNTTDKGKTFTCKSMGYGLDKHRIYYWKDALMTSPVEISEEMYCGEGS